MLQAVKLVVISDAHMMKCDPLWLSCLCEPLQVIKSLPPIKVEWHVKLQGCSVWRFTAVTSRDNSLNPSRTQRVRNHSDTRNKNKTLFNLFPLVFNKLIKSHSASDGDKLQASNWGAQQKGTDLSGVIQRTHPMTTYSQWHDVTLNNLAHKQLLLSILCQ